MSKPVAETEPQMSKPDVLKSGIDVQNEQLIRLSHVPRLKNLPQGFKEKHLHVGTIYRWVQRGIGGIRLDSIKTGGTLCTSHEALQRFFDQLSSSRQAPTASHLPASGDRMKRLDRVTAIRSRQITDASTRARSIIGCAKP